jgi:hypothetical protein
MQDRSVTQRQDINFPPVVSLIGARELSHPISDVAWLVLTSVFFRSTDTHFAVPL